MMHPENLPRPIGSYDPDEPLIVRYGDVIGARNAVAQLINALTDEQDPPGEYRQQTVQMCVAAGVERDEPGREFRSLDDTVRWLAALRDRLGECLPFPNTGRMP